jgi:hypothetical protein
MTGTASRVMWRDMRLQKASMDFPVLASLVGWKRSRSQGQVTMPDRNPWQSRPGIIFPHLNLARTSPNRARNR